MFTSTLLVGVLLSQGPPSAGGNPPVLTPAPSNAATDCLGMCPADKDTPFLRLPRVTGLFTCDETRKDDCAGSEQFWKHTFHRPARFSQMRHTQTGEPYESEGVIIHEGMTFTVYPNGIYDLVFNATVPAMPVTLRLQLVFTPNHPLAKEPIRLTLPPIAIEPELRESPAYWLGRTVQVKHRGQSSIFVQVCDGLNCQMPITHKKYSDDLMDKIQAPIVPGSVVPGSPYCLPVSANWIIGRSGVARFGSPVPNNETLFR